MKRWVYIAGVLAMVPLGVVGFIASRAPASRPPSTEKLEASSERIERGRYLANHVALCIDCHSDHALERYGMPIIAGTEGAGGIPLDAKHGVPGSVCAPNITPDPATGIAKWTDGEVLRAVREGVSRDGHALYPSMPYTYYRSMSDEDARAVVVYLRTLKPVDHATPARHLDFTAEDNIKSIPRPLVSPVDAPRDEENHLAYGRYLANLGACIECHTPHDADSNLVAGREFAGGLVMKGPWGTVVSTNITPDRTSYVGLATKAQFVARFKSFAGMTADTAPGAGKGSNTAMPWLALAGMTESDLGAIYDYLHTVPPIENRVTAFPDAAPLPVPAPAPPPHAPSPG